MPPPSKETTKDKALEEMIPAKYLKEYQSVFEEGAVNRFPKSRHYDHEIELVEGYKIPRNKGIYFLTYHKQQKLDK